MKRYQIAAGALASIALLGLSACAVTPAPEAAPEPTSDELSGSLTIACGSQEDLCQAWTAAFTAETGVEADFVRLSSGEAVARFDASRANPEFDVWHGGPVDGFAAAVEADLLEPYVSPNAEAIPAEYRDPEGYWTGVYIGALGFCSNQMILDELGVDVPESWSDLLDPRLAQQISIAHPSTSGTAFTALWAQVSRLGDQEAGFDYMRQLHNNVLQYSKSGSAPGQLAGRGEVAVGVIFSHDCVKYQEEGLTDLVVSFPEEGTGYEVGGVALLAGSQNPTAAQAYVDWALTADAQAIGATVNSFQVLTNPEAPEDPRMVRLDEIELVEYDVLEAAAAKPALTARFDAEIAAQPKE